MGAGCSLAGTTQNGAHPGGDFPWAERLDDVIVGTNLQPDDAVDFFLARGQKHDRQGGKLTDAATDFKAAFVGQANVQHQQVDRVVAQPLHALASQTAPVDVEAFGAQGIHQRIGDGGLVFDNQNPVRHGLLCP